jgi:hypothetical protein
MVAVLVQGLDAPERTGDGMDGDVPVDVALGVRVERRVCVREVSEGGCVEEGAEVVEDVLGEGVERHFFFASGRG